MNERRLMNETNNDPCLDPAHLDRLVDGELDAPEYHQLLKTLDETPGGWKRCALRFLEAQALEKELKDFFANPAPSTSTAQSNPIPLEPSVGASDKPIRASARRPIRRPSAKTWQSLGSVAALILAFVLGWWIPENSSQDLPVNSPVSNQPTQLTHATHLRTPSGNLELGVDSPARGEQQVRVPFYPADQYASQAPRQIEQLVNQVATRGAQVNRFHTLYPEDLNETESVLVPLELISVDPTGDFQ